MRLTSSRAGDACVLTLTLAIAIARCATVTALRAPSWIRDDRVHVRGGTFAMGSDDPDANANERPVHPVTVASFDLDRTEVTVKAYDLCVQAGKCSAPESYLDERGNYRSFCNWHHPQDRAQHPVNCVDFQQAASFCAWAGKRLPTEEEWEYAARAGSRTEEKADARKYPWGNAPPDQTRLNACGSECPQNLTAKRFPSASPMYAASDGWPETAPVGSFPAGASKDGALDLAGNVWEWTASWYATYDGSRGESKRVLRGGSWGGGDPRTERTTNRFRLDPQSRGQFLGFRCAN
jgi:formylglycine-generating enzyme required for sulfatase activity